MILYALVARGKIVLAEYTKLSGNFPTVTRVLLSKISEQDGKMSYVYDKHIFHYIVDSGITFLCMCEEDSKKRIAFLYLDEIKKQWRANYANLEQTAVAFSMQTEYSPILAKHMDFYNTNPTDDSIGKIRAQIDNVKEVTIIFFIF